VTVQERDRREGRIVTFYSYKGGTGRTMALANVAWILASNGHRVLMIDWDLEAPGLHRFFHPLLDPARLADRDGVINMIDEYCFHAGRALANPEEAKPESWWARYASVSRNAIPVNFYFDGGGSLDFVSAARQYPVFSANLTPLDWEKFYDELSGSQFLDEMRKQLKQEYDYVLLDSRTGLSDFETICTKDLPDDLVICFTLSNQNIEGAAGLAEHVEEMRRSNSLRTNIRILPVVTRIEDAEIERRDVGLAVARARFARYVREIEPRDPDRYWSEARIPYKALYAYEELLAVFEDDPGDPGSVLAACKRLTGLITNGTVTGMQPISEAVRARHREAYRRSRPVQPSDVYISGLPSDANWVAWLGWLLRGLGYEVAAEEPEANAGRPLEAEVADRMQAAAFTVAVVSGAYQASSVARAVWNYDYGRSSTQSGRLIPVRVDEAELGDLFRQRHVVSVAALDETAAVAAILRAFSSQLTVEQALAKAADAGERVRYPLSKPAVWRVPNRLAAFTGRDEELVKLRRQLGTGTATAVLPQALFGLGGVGKTALVLEYAHRAQYDYDVVWWIRAEQRNIANEDLAHLGEALGLRSADNINAAAEAAREALAAGVPSTRWLLIFDNAEDPSTVKPLIPRRGTGHVLITSRNSAWKREGSFGSLEVDVFSREESVEHLMRRVSGLTEEDARAVAETLGDLPLAIELAAAWLDETGMSVESYIERLRTELSRTLEAGRAPNYEGSVVATWRVAIAEIRRNLPAAARLLQLLAYFGPEPIALDLVYSDAMIEALLPVESRLRDNKMMIGRYIQELGRYALAKVYRGDLNALQVHRLIQQVVREEIAEDEEMTLRRQVHAILAWARPTQGDVDNPANWDWYGQIWPHVFPSNAIAGNGEVRQLYVDRVRYLRFRGELKQAIALARETIATWNGNPSIGPDDPRNLSMGFELAVALRFNGETREALEIDEDVYRRQLAHPDIGEDHIATLMTAGGLAGDYRALGRFQEALELDRRTYDSFVGLFGNDHPRTLVAANNYAVSLRAVGRCFEALEVDERTLAERLRVLGESHPFSFFSAINLARDLRDCGDRTASLELLRRTYADCRKVLGVENPLTQDAAKALAIGLRKAGSREESSALIAELTTMLGRPEEVTAVPRLSFALNVASDLAARDRTVEALALAESVRDKYEAALSADHPDTLVSANNVMVYLRRLGRFGEARELGEDTLRRFKAVLGAVHLFSAACAINVANVLADCGEHAAAQALLQETRHNLVELLEAVPSASEREQHPDLLACDANLAVTLHDLGRLEEAQEKRGKLLGTLAALHGETHPNTVALSEWRRIDRELDPMPG